MHVALFLAVCFAYAFACGGYGDYEQEEGATFDTVKAECSAVAKKLKSAFKNDKNALKKLLKEAKPVVHGLFEAYEADGDEQALADGLHALGESFAADIAKVHDDTQAEVGALLDGIASHVKDFVAEAMASAAEGGCDCCGEEGCDCDCGDGSCGCGCGCGGGADCNCEDGSCGCGCGCGGGADCNCEDGSCGCGCGCGGGADCNCEDGSCGCGCGGGADCNCEDGNCGCGCGGDAGDDAGDDAGADAGDDAGDGDGNDIGEAALELIDDFEGSGSGFASISDL